jgi:hypothetical protein
MISSGGVKIYCIICFSYHRLQLLCTHTVLAEEIVMKNSQNNVYQTIGKWYKTKLG